MIKQAMILAAGKGTRMRPLTLTMPKPLVPVADKPLIVWHIERLAKAGIQRVVLNAGYLSDILIDGLAALDLPNRLGVELMISVEMGEPLETAGGIRYALHQKLLNDEPFILINGDVWTEYDFAPLINHQLDGKLAHLVMTKNPEHNLAGDFVLIDDELHTKADNENRPTVTFAGISVMSPKLIERVGVGEVAALAPFLKAAINDALVTGELMQAMWVDVGTLERLAWVDHYAKKPKSVN